MNLAEVSLFFPLLSLPLPLPLFIYLFLMIFLERDSWVSAINAARKGALWDPENIKVDSPHGWDSVNHAKAHLL